MSSIKIEHSDRIVYKNEQGKYHRLDGPAREFKDGYKEWYINGIRHREDGPAIEWNFFKRWYLNNKIYTEQDWQQEVIRLKLKRILYL
jgi:hypothetical protein